MVERGPCGTCNHLYSTYMLQHRCCSLVASQIMHTRPGNVTAPKQIHHDNEQTQRAPYTGSVVYCYSRQRDDASPLLALFALALVSQIVLNAEASGSSGFTQKVQKCPRILSHTNSSVLNARHRLNCSDRRFTCPSSGEACTQHTHTKTIRKHFQGETMTSI